MLLQSFVWLDAAARTDALFLLQECVMYTDKYVHSWVHTCFCETDKSGAVFKKESIYI